MLLMSRREKYSWKDCSTGQEENHPTPDKPLLLTLSLPPSPPPSPLPLFLPSLPPFSLSPTLLPLIPLSFRTKEQVEEEEMLLAELKKIEMRKKEREKKQQDLQKLISAAEHNAERCESCSCGRG